MDPQACLTLVDSLVENRGGVVGSKIYFSPGYEYHRSRYKESERGKVLWYVGGVIDWENMDASHRGVDEIDTGQFKHIRYSVQPWFYDAQDVVKVLDVR